MDRPADGSKFGERGEIVDADFLVGLLDTFSFGKYNLLAIKNVLNAPAKITPATEQQDKTTEKQDDGSQGIFSQLVLFIYVFLVFTTMVLLDIFNFQLRLVFFEFAKYT